LDGSPWKTGGYTRKLSISACDFDLVKIVRIVDLSHTLTPTMPVYPGTQPPVFQTASSIEEDGFAERVISLCSHAGTHVDAPSHTIFGAKGLDQFGIGHFMGKAIKLDLVRNNANAITVEDLAGYRDRILKSDFLLFETGWSRLWGAEGYFFGYPVLSHDAALWLHQFNLKGLGFDVISADEPSSRDLPIHRILLGNNRILIENLTRLDALPQERDFTFMCFPLKMERADGSPVRAVALIP
jgi:arylformamidase